MTGWAKTRKVWHYYFADLAEPVCGFPERPRKPGIPTEPYVQNGELRCRDCRSIEGEMAAMPGEAVEDGPRWCVLIACPHFEVRHEHERPDPVPA